MCIWIHAFSYTWDRHCWTFFLMLSLICLSLFLVNYLIIEALERYDFFYGESFKVECPTGSGKIVRLRDVAKEISSRIVHLFLPDESGRRPCHGECALYKDDPHWKELVLFYEYFHGDTGRGIGARWENFSLPFLFSFFCPLYILFLVVVFASFPLIFLTDNLYLHEFNVTQLKNMLGNFL